MQRLGDARKAHLRGGPLVLGVVLLALAYVVTALLGLSVAHYQSNATLIWPPTGIALAALVLYGPRLWPGVFLGALVATLSVPTPLAGALAIALGNTLEAVLGAILLVRFARFDPGLARTRDVLTFTAVGVLGCTLVSASIGTATLGAIGAIEDRDPALVWLFWWLGDVGGAVLVAPFLLVCARGRPRWSELAARAETWIVLALLGAANLVAFGPWLGGSDLPGALATLPFPLIVWAGLRLGPRGAVTAAALTCGAAVAATALYGGPLAGDSAHESALLLWAYGAGLGASAAILAAAVTERDTAERARRAAEDAKRAIELQMERAQRLEMLGVLASGIAHDFNNLLLIVRANAELAAVSEQREIDAALGEIGRAADRAASLCRQLLDYAGASVRRPEILSLGALVEDVVSLLRGSTPRSIAIRSTASDERLYGDAAQLRQLLMNLVLNAIEAMPPEGGHIDIRTRRVDASAVDLRGAFVAPEVTAPRSWIVLEVEDDGAGMDEETRRRVFDPFFTTKEHGRGLGLAALLGIVRAHGGALLLESAPGRGTTFRVLLPPLEEAPIEDDAEASPGRPPSVAA